MTLELTYPIIISAMNGDSKALEYILQYYDPYITSLCTYETFDADGFIQREIDEDMKIEIQQKLVVAIQYEWKIRI